MGSTFYKTLVRIFFVCTVSVLAQFKAVAVNTTVMGDLPSQLVECSGVDFTGGASFWTHNDGYGDNNLYKVSNTGALSRTVNVIGAVNSDWEDLTHDYSRTYMFIGDFGNNACDRTNLHIYRTPYPSIAIYSCNNYFFFVDKSFIYLISNTLNFKFYLLMI